MGIAPSSPEAETHRTDGMSSDGTSASPDLNGSVSAASTPPSIEAGSCGGDSLEQRGSADVWDEEGDCTSPESDRPPAWATTPVLPKPPKASLFHGRSPLKTLKDTR